MMAMAGDAETGRDPLAFVEATHADSLPKSFGERLCSRAVGIGADDNELFSAPASAAVNIADIALQNVGNVFQDSIAGGMAKGIVDDLKKIDINKNNSKIFLIAQGGLFSVHAGGG